MIATVTLNPSVDVVLTAPRLNVGAVNRASAETMYPGGKGVNVSIMAHRLGMDTLALGFIAGPMGHALRGMVQAEGVREDFITLGKGQTRVNVKIPSLQGTEINGPGPAIDTHSYEKLVEQLDRLKKPDMLVLSGAIPPSLPADTYAEIAEFMASKGVETVVDCEGPALRQALDKHPFLIKPNVAELGQLYSQMLMTETDIVKCAQRAQDEGARNVLVSRGPDGAILLMESGEAYACEVTPGTLVNAVGAGDSMVAAFLAQWCTTQDLESALDFSVAVACATAYSPWLASVETLT
ncbi:MAG: 1-phosphofructokinase [Propionibacteriaceae bacterium]|jgi:1-phosphofructokinase|nr:1-phosphofructokinase [Propionibacteriaceae bacterium]